MLRKKLARSIVPPRFHPKPKPTTIWLLCPAQWGRSILTDIHLVIPDKRCWAALHPRGGEDPGNGGYCQSCPHCWTDCSPLTGTTIVSGRLIKRTADNLNSATSAALVRPPDAMRWAASAGRRRDPGQIRILSAADKGAEKPGLRDGGPLWMPQPCSIEAN
ncbi:hypothetical protein VTI28DRAFT_363 [Corynascus sepedonium]